MQKRLLFFLVILTVTGLAGFSILSAESGEQLDPMPLSDPLFAGTFQFEGDYLDQFALPAPYLKIEIKPRKSVVNYDKLEALRKARQQKQEALEGGMVVTPELETSYGGASPRDTLPDLDTNF